MKLQFLFKTHREERLKPIALHKGPQSSGEKVPAETDSRFSDVPEVFPPVFSCRGTGGAELSQRRL